MSKAPRLFVRQSNEANEFVRFSTTATWHAARCSWGDATDDLQLSYDVAERSDRSGDCTGRKQSDDSDGREDYDASKPSPNDLVERRHDLSILANMSGVTRPVIGAPGHRPAPSCVRLAARNTATPETAIVPARRPPRSPPLQALAHLETLPIAAQAHSHPRRRKPSARE